MSEGEKETVRSGPLATTQLNYPNCLTNDWGGPTPARRTHTRTICTIFRK